ncbi:MAG: DUF2817 domain-containing protein, partial [Bdellovibrionales bacterium]|nr:DUF2817 domain-containing protein [Bdellovibrionales bacterium]
MFESPNLPREDLPPRVPSKADSLASLVATHNPPRNYDLQVAERTRALAREFEVTLISEINASGRTFEILGVDTAPNGSRPGGTIFLSGGVHGEEPAGVVAVLDFLEVHAPAFLDQFRFRAIPCVNPSGYQSGLRKGVNGVDLNRNFFDGSQQPEVQAVYSFLKSGPQEFAATFDFHEIDIFWADEGFSASDNPLGYYFYETTRVAEKRFGPKMIEQANVFGEPCIWKSIYGDKNE